MTLEVEILIQKFGRYRCRRAFCDSGKYRHVSEVVIIVLVWLLLRT